MCQPTRPGYRPTQTADQAQPVTSHGFTLLEIMVALTIVAIVFTALFAVFDRVTDVAGTVDRRARLSQEARLVVLQIRRDLDSIVLPETAGADTQTSQNASSNSSSIVPITGQSPEMEFFSEVSPVLTFTTRAGLSLNATFPRHEISVVTYTLEPDSEDGERFALVRSQRLLIDSVSKDQIVNETTLLLSDHISSLQIRFFDEQSGRAVTSWRQDRLGADDKRQKSPVWVAVHVKFTGPDGEAVGYTDFHELRPPEKDVSTPQGFFDTSMYKKRGVGSSVGRG